MLLSIVLAAAACLEHGGPTTATSDRVVTQPDRPVPEPVLWWPPEIVVASDASAAEQQAAQLLAPWCG
eukprot:COSAG06_NODE_49148_length_327_cov_0.907895_1_plen_67_part_10